MSLIKRKQALLFNDSVILHIYEISFIGILNPQIFGWCIFHHSLVIFCRIICCVTFFLSPFKDSSSHFFHSKGTYNFIVLLIILYFKIHLDISPLLNSFILFYTRHRLRCFRQSSEEPTTLHLETHMLLIMRAFQKHPCDIPLGICNTSSLIWKRQKGWTTRILTLNNINVNSCSSHCYMFMKQKVSI